MVSEAVLAEFGSPPWFRWLLPLLPCSGASRPRAQDNGLVTPGWVPMAVAVVGAARFRVKILYSVAVTDLVHRSRSDLPDLPCHRSPVTDLPPYSVAVTDLPPISRPTDLHHSVAVTDLHHTAMKICFGRPVVGAEMSPGVATRHAESVRHVGAAASRRFRCHFRRSPLRA